LRQSSIAIVRRKLRIRELPNAEKIRNLTLDPTKPSTAHFISIRPMSAANILRLSDM
jgi:hypothetical protein